MTFKKDIEEIISTISKEFQENELTYLALTSKIELPLRDKIAFEFHKIYKDKYLVCREWKPKGNGSVDRIDLAIIDKSSLKPVCLIEFKAKSVVHHQSEYTSHLSNDLIKIRDIAQNDNNIELYYIYFNNIVCLKDDLADAFSNSIKYFKDLKKKAKNQTIEECKRIWHKHLLENKLLENKSDYVLIQAKGDYYGHSVIIGTFIYGPIRASEIKELSSYKYKKNDSQSKYHQRNN
jgi:hypothetical protein